MDNKTTGKPITLSEVEKITRIYEKGEPPQGDDLLDVKIFQSRITESQLGDGVLNKLLSNRDYFEHVCEILPLNQNLNSIEFASVLEYVGKVEKEEFSDGFFPRYIVHPEAVNSLVHLRTIFDIAQKKGTELGVKSMVAQLVKHENIVLDKGTFNHVFYNVAASPNNPTYMIFKNKKIMGYDQIQKKVEKKYGTFIQSN